MIIGTVEFDLHLPGVHSLKEKRGRLKSLLARVRNKFNVSIAEVGMNDNLRMAQIGAAVVSNDKAFVDKTIARIASMIGNEPEMYISDYRVEII